MRKKTDKLVLRVRNCGSVRVSGVRIRVKIRIKVSVRVSYRVVSHNGR